MLEARPPYFPGWPVNRDDLDPFYAQASRLCHLHGEYDRGRNYSNEFWSKELSADVPELPGFDVEMYQFIGPRYLNFATRTFDGGTTIADSAAQVIVNASLLDIDRSGRRVNGLRVASMDDSIPPKKATEFTIKADAYVLACGAVANARQLLLGNIGNEYDLVGRYFMAHALTQGSNVVSQTAYLDDSQTRYMAGHLPGNVRWTDRAGVGVNARFIPSAETTRKWPDTQTPPPPH
jgi:choline dehydrogenase-like flavoprotein